jgi:hypothetical protein
VLVSETVTVPVGFACYGPNPVQTRWAKQGRAFEIETHLRVETCQGYHYEHAF